MTPDEEAHRLTCEARFWLRSGCTTPSTVDPLIDRIARRRGHAVAERLREAMREQWRRRAEWMEKERRA